MLYLVLILVLAALGLLVTALITANSLWAWISIALSLIAAVALFIDWLRRRKSETAEATEPAETEATEAEAEPEEPGAADGEAVTAAEAGEHGAEDPEAPTPDAKAAGVGAALEAMVAREGTEAAQRPEEAPAERTAAADTVSDDIADSDGSDDLAGVPAEEETDAADLLIVCELEDQVIVVDEHPRYHLAECRWLAYHDTIPIAVSEARELGFTPCARCGPDAKLAERVRKKKRKVGGLSKE